MACGYKYCPDTKCGTKYLFAAEDRAACRAAQNECFPKLCNGLLALGEHGPVLYDACLGACQNSRGKDKAQAAYLSTDDYLCKVYGGAVLYDYYGIQRCGVDISTTQVGQQNEVLEKELQNNNRMLLYAGLAFMTLLGGWLFMKK